MARKNKWIQRSIKKKGAFTRWCKQRGYKGVTQACIEEGKRSRNTTVKRRANLASTLRKLPRRKKKRR